MNTLESLNRDIAPVRSELDFAFARSEITKPLYFKGLVQIAYEYVLAGYHTEAIGVVFGVDSDYFFGFDYEEQVEADDTYREQAGKVIAACMSRGYQTGKVLYA